MGAVKGNHQSVGAEGDASSHQATAVRWFWELGHVLYKGPLFRRCQHRHLDTALGQPGRRASVPNSVSDTSTRTLTICQYMQQHGI